MWRKGTRLRTGPWGWRKSVRVVAWTNCGGGGGKATASGRGPGKAAKVAWLIDWMMTTRLGSTSIVTANTEPQLKTRTFAEIGKWTALLINAHWFETTVLSVKPAPWFK